LVPRLHLFYKVIATALLAYIFAFSSDLMSIRKSIQLIQNLAVQEITS